MDHLWLHNKDNWPVRVISSSETGSMHSGTSYFAEFTINEVMRIHQLFRIRLQQ
jgi:hypothetical protein